MGNDITDIDVSLQDFKGNFDRGLDLVTRAIHGTSNHELAFTDLLATAVKRDLGIHMDLQATSCHQRNQILATILRKICFQDGFMAAWSFLVKAAPNIGLHPRLVEDICIAARVYGSLKQGKPWVTHKSASDISMSIGCEATYGSICRIGPKSLGGMAWRVNEDYLAFLQNPAWSHWGYTKGIPPCVAMGWIGVQMKVTPPADAAEVVKLQLLGTIDFDMDDMEDNRAGFKSGFDAAAIHVSAAGTKLQGAALIGMINYDLQNHIRPIQNQWAIENRGPFNLRPADVSPQDWTAYLVADCAALVPFAYDDDYNVSRTGMINGMIHLQCQDLLFDTGCSNRVATVPYVQAAGVAKDGMHAAYAVAAFEASANYFKTSIDGVPPFGYSACVVAGPWGPFGTRYRVWERCVKYIRQLKRSKLPEAKALLELSSADLMLKDYSLQKEVGHEWARAMKSNPSDLVPRPTVPYLVSVEVSELFGIPGVKEPDLCESCKLPFENVMFGTDKEVVHAAEGLPRNVTVDKDAFGRPASLAVGFRRAALWACGDNCCDTCASRIGYWSDAAAFIVLSALMRDEPLLGPSAWMMQNYFVGCVVFAPVSLPYLLSGFDLLADLHFDDGAMGTRDIVDI